MMANCFYCCIFLIVIFIMAAYIKMFMNDLPYMKDMKNFTGKGAEEKTRCQATYTAWLIAFIAFWGFMALHLVCDCLKYYAFKSKDLWLLITASRVSLFVIFANSCISAWVLYASTNTCQTWSWYTYVVEINLWLAAIGGFFQVGCAFFIGPKTDQE